MHALLDEYLVWIAAQNFSDDTVNTRRAYIGYFLDWCQRARPRRARRRSRGRCWSAISGRSISTARRTAQPLTFRTQNTRLRALKGWFRWLARQNHLLHNPASELILPRLENRLPKYMLNAEEAEQVLQQPDITRSRRPARPRHPGNVLLDRHAAHGSSRV